MLSQADKERYECITPVFGVTVERAFPAALPHLDEASKCYALERYTAGIFHLMCAIQTPLNFLGKKFHVNKSATWSNWEPVMRDIEAAINTLPQKNARQRAKRECYKQVIEPLWIIKDARRNPTMHGRGRANCSSDEARQIWTGVEAFFQRVADDLVRDV